LSPERRYSEQEITEIFRQAAEAQETAQGQMSQSEGLTLAELQEIGKEAGITPEFISSSAAAVDRMDLVHSPTRYLGIPISAARTVDLPGPLSDANWNRLVEDLRDTFEATGKLQRDGAVREWANGNLRAVVEPTETGHRLSLRTLKGNAKGLIWAGFAAAFLGIVTLTQVLFSGDPFSARTLSLVMMSVALLGSMGFSAFRLPFWAKERERQMDKIATRAITLANNSRPMTLPGRETSSRIDVESLDESIEEVPTSSRTKIRG